MRKPKTPILRYLALSMGLGSLVLSSCTPNLVGHPNTLMSPHQMAQSRAEVNAIDDDNFIRRHRERMSDAHAEEVATRNNPDSVSTTSVYAPTYAPRYGW